MLSGAGKNAARLLSKETNTAPPPQFSPDLLAFTFSPPNRKKEWNKTSSAPSPVAVAEGTSSSSAPINLGIFHTGIFTFFPLPEGEETKEL